MLGFSRCNDGTIGDEAVKNPNPRVCIVIETVAWRIEISANSRLTSARKKGCTR